MADVKPETKPETKKEVEKEVSLSEALGTKKVTLVDKTGKVHELAPLDFEDVADIEDLTDVGVGEWLKSKNRILIMVLWGILRKEGLSQQEIDDRRWKLTQRQVGRMFDGHQYEQIWMALIELLRVSGWIRDKEAGKSRPPEGPPSGEP